MKTHKIEQAGERTQTAIDSREMTTHKVEDAIGEQCFIVPNAVVFVEIAYDQDTSNPLTDCDGMGHIHSFNSRHINSISPDQLPELIAKHGKDCVVPLSYFEHGRSLWDVQHGANISRCPDMQWDGVTFAGVWTPDESCREHIELSKHKGRHNVALECAAQACEVYTSWINGDCYGYKAEAFTPLTNRDGETSEDWSTYSEMGESLGEDSCWGFIGSDMDYMIAENIQPFVDRFAK